VPPYHLYGLFHGAWIAGIIGTSIAVSRLCRRNRVPHLVTRVALTCLLVGGELLSYWSTDIRFPNKLPLNLCNVTTWVTMIACLTLSPWAVEFAYFAASAAPEWRC
jgi:uncharacterized membrane protein YwaF